MSAIPLGFKPRKPYAKRGASLADRLEHYTDRTTTCWEWTGYRNLLGYGVIRHRRQTLLAHRASYGVHVATPGELKVCHHCDNPSCIRPDHLFLGTDLDNTRDMVAKGRMRKARGEGHADAKLTEAAVKDIRQATPHYGYCVQLSLKYGVTVSTIQKVRRGQTWKHLP